MGGSEELRAGRAMLQYPIRRLILVSQPVPAQTRDIFVLGRKIDESANKLALCNRIRCTTAERPQRVT